MGRFFSVKKLILTFFITLATALVGNSFAMHVYAADVNVRFGSNYYNKSQGERFPMGLYVVNPNDSAAGIGKYHVEISYDPQFLEYSDGVTSQAGPGRLILDGTGDGIQNKTFIYFNALYGGTTNVTVVSAEVYTTDGELMTVTVMGTVPVYLTGTPPENDGTVDGADATDDDNAAADGADATDGDNAAAGGADATEGDNAAAGGADATEGDNAVADGADDNIDNSAAGSNGNGAGNVGDDTAALGNGSADTDKEAGDVNAGNNDSGALIGSGEDRGNSDGNGPGKDILRYAVIAVAGIVSVVIVIFIIRGIVHISSKRRKMTAKLQNSSDNREWAFEFDTIDDDKEQNEAWESSMAELGEEETDLLGKYRGEAAGSGDEEFLFEFDSIPEDR